MQKKILQIKRDEQKTQIIKHIKSNLALQFHSNSKDIEIEVTEIRDITNAMENEKK